MSRRASPITHANYCHRVADVTSSNYELELSTMLEGQSVPVAVVYCAAIGVGTSHENLNCDLQVFDVNLMGAVKTSAQMLPRLQANGGGHFIVLSSQADAIVNPLAASYSASKAAMSFYFEGLGLAFRKSPVKIVNVRFGFVDTKLARAGFQPFKITREKAAMQIYRLLSPRAPLRFTSPFRTAILVGLVSLIQRLRVAVS
jgi:short-subunit dehydrogenase